MAEWQSWLFRRAISWAGPMIAFRFNMQARQGRKVGLRTLQNILLDNRDTEFGKAHHFDRILEAESFLEAYQAEVPLSDYADYEAGIRRIQAGETNVLFTKPMVGLAFTSGTTGPSKLVPLTAKLRTTGIFFGIMACTALLSRSSKVRRPLERGISLMSYASRPQAGSGTTVGTATSMGIKRIVPVISHLWCSPPEVFALTDMPSARYLHALYGLRERRAQYVQAVFSSAVLQWLIAMEQRWDELLHDIEHGTLSENLSLSPDIREHLTSQLSPDPVRAAELRLAAEPGFAGIVPRIWPTMVRIGGVTSGNFSVNVPAIRSYVGDIPFYGAIYAASEGTMGIGLLPDDDQYVLIPDILHFEFIPLVEMEKERPQTLPLESLTVGERYEVVVTNPAGLYRYRIGDIVEVTGYFHQLPTLRFVRRKLVELSLVGEKTSELHLNTAVEKMVGVWLAEEDQVCLRNYTFALDISKSPGYYVLYVELAMHTIAPVILDQLEKVAQVLDQGLQEANPTLVYARQILDVGLPLVKLLKPGSFDILFEALYANNPGGNYNQIKIPRYTNDARLLTLLEEQVIATSS